MEGGKKGEGEGEVRGDGGGGGGWRREEGGGNGEEGRKLRARGGRR